MLYSWLLLSLLINNWLVQRLGIALLLFFSRYQIWWLFLWFELSLLPIVFIILGYGNHRVRIPAALYLIIYTTVFSLPTIGILLTLDISYSFLIRDNYIRLLSIWILLLSFLVKLPVFGLHLWLPRAHVESPTIGICILAGVLLKTGRFGIWLILKWLQTVFNPVWSLVGASFISMVACIQTDIKRIVAFSSIAHLNLILAAMVSGRNYGFRAFILLSLCHGLISSSMFYAAGLSRTSSRLVFYLNKISPTAWLLILIFNLGIPPRISFLREVISFIRLTLRHIRNIIILIIGGFFMIWFRILVWLGIKTLSNVQTNANRLVILWRFLIISLLWINPTLSF